MTLNESQIDHLFQFVRSKYVRYYDVQLELVDHLASAIEKEMASHEFLTFEQALQRVYGRWPITGFAQFIEEKRKGLKKYWRRRFWAYLRQYFRLPKILIALLLALVFYQLSKMGIPLLGGELNLLFIVLIGLAIKSYFDTFNFKIEPPRYGKEGLLSYEVFNEQIGFLLGPACGFIYIFITEGRGINTALSTYPIAAILFSALTAFTSIVLHAKATVFNEWMDEDIQAKYPEFLKLV